MTKVITTQQFDYGSLNKETRAFVQERAVQIHETARRTAQGIVRIGEWLTEVKARLGHGKFLEWIKKEFAWKIRSAQAFMNVYEHFKDANFALLEIDVSALYLIAAPSTPEPVREEAVRRAISGETVQHSTVREVVKQYNRTGDEGIAVKQLFDAVVEARAQEAKDRERLPSPAEARRIAIETGAHTLDRNGNYQPPMTVEAQADWRADWKKVHVLYEFLHWAGQATAEEASETIHRHGWREEFAPFARLAAAWMADFNQSIWEEQQKNEKS